MNNAQMRRDFEAHIDEMIVNIALQRAAPGDYKTAWVQSGWQFWQAAIQKAVPPGYQLVPVEPTSAMLVFSHKQAWVNAVKAAPMPASQKGNE